LAQGLGFVALMISPFTSFAQEDSNKTPADLTAMKIEDLMNVEVDTVYGASKFEQKVTSAPSYVTIVSADEISQHAYRTLADVLRSVPGFYVTYDRNYSDVGVRGFDRPGDYNNRILVMVDGHRLNEEVYEGAYVGTEFPVDLDLVDRVEVACSYPPASTDTLCGIAV
jgi:iron complex outermembrane receptor protein